MPAHDTHASPPKRRIPGAALILTGGLLTLVGGGVLVAFGSDGTIGSGHHRIVSPANAIVTPVTRIRHMADVSSVIGRTTVRVSTRNVAGGRPAFVGVARAADVDRYLAGASTAEAADIGPRRITVDSPHGPGRPSVLPPATKRFWIAHATGGAALRWHVRDGRYRFVMMSADGRRGVSTEATVAIGAANLAWMAAVVTIIGLLVMGGGTFLYARSPSDTTEPARTTAPATA
jgi:hypothetical protein